MSISYDGMLTAYIQAAMRRAHYEVMSDGEGFYGEVPGLDGFWANEETLEASGHDALLWRLDQHQASRGKQNLSE